MDRQAIVGRYRTEVVGIERAVGERARRAVSEVARSKPEILDLERTDAVLGRRTRVTVHKLDMRTRYHEADFAVVEIQSFGPAGCDRSGFGRTERGDQPAAHRIADF